jgi:flagellin
MVIQHNISALNAERQYSIVNKDKTKSMEKLSSGYRINRAADDAAGLSISEKMRVQIRGLKKGVTNTQDGVSLCQVADGALSEMQSMVHRISELSIQAANCTNTDTDRQMIQDEISQIIKEVDRTSDNTTFNTFKIFGENSGGGQCRFVKFSAGY